MIHKFKMNNYNIVLDVNSGSVHMVDDVAYDILGHYENEKDNLNNIFKDKYSNNDIVTAVREIEVLENKGFMFSKDDFDGVLDKINSRNPVVKALCLHIAHDCNLKCKYCFAEEGEYHGSRCFMTSEIGKKALDFLIKNSGNRRNLEVDFFGGEPLMNFDVVKEIVEYGRKIEKENNKNIRFTITTNGVLLGKEINEYINENMSNVVLSIDGRKEVNDRMRQTINGKSSYDIIMPKFKELAESRNQDNYYVRGTFTRNNLDFSKDVLHLADEGFKQISVEPVVAPPEAEYSLREEDLPQIFEEYENLAVEMIKRNKDFNFFHFMIDLTGGPCVAKRMVGCGSGTEYLAVTPTGDLFPCHQFVGDEKFKMGNVDDGVLNFAQREEFEKCNVCSKPECATCWAKFYCSGGCAANAYQNYGTILGTYKIGCELQKKRTECALMIKVHDTFSQNK